MAEEANNEADDLLEANLTTGAERTGIGEAELESVYSLAYDYYKTGRYADAEALFRFLVLYSHTSKKYWLGFGAVLQVQRKYQEAINVYSSVSMLLDVSWAKPPYYAAECYLAMGDREKARMALAHVREFADKTTEEGRQYLAKADALEKKINAKP